ncbi:hypothetical protein [Rhabdochlamydiaceae symbiont of Dictyostelium giganteum]|uniref:hypothetical protein n=1 Tax=Rhabdochlamydiaceae symbiont of Dictyostelium giganteum TaxID=3342349 RepID=UPI00384E8996
MTKMNNSLEKTLNSRLKMVGIILCVFALIAAIWDLLPFPEEELSELLLEVEEPPPSLNNYFVSGAFVFMGITSLLFYVKKKSELAQQIPPE